MADSHFERAIKREFGGSRGSAFKLKCKLYTLILLAGKGNPINRLSGGYLTNILL